MLPSRRRAADGGELRSGLARKTRSQTRRQRETRLSPEFRAQGYSARGRSEQYDGHDGGAVGVCGTVTSTGNVHATCAAAQSLWTDPLTSTSSSFAFG